MTRPRFSSPAMAQPFFTTEEQRLSLARERFFEEGIRPSGLISEGVIQSWSRCMLTQRDPRESIAFNAITRGQIQTVLSRNRMLLDAASSELMQLETTLAGTTCQVMLTDAKGMVVQATRATATHHQVLRLASRVGVDLAEECVGTTAPGIVARTGQPCSVRAAEHFFECIQLVQCAAVPIRDIHQQVAGVLNVSIELQTFGFDAVAMATLHAASIENKLLQAQSLEHIVVHLQTIPSLLCTPMEGLAGVNSDGMLTWANGAAARLLGKPHVGPLVPMREVLGLELCTLVALTRRREATMHQLPNGLTVWLLANMQGNDGANGVFSLYDAKSDMPVAVEPAPVAGVPDVAPAAPASLRESDQQLIERTASECGGNIAKTARILGVSRGLVYRHLNRRAKRSDEGVSS